MNRQAVNPYLPSWEYIPDGEPHVFNGRVYVYGSHDRFNAPIFCVNDYVCWSAPVEDLSEWRYEGVIYRKKQDPKNPLGYHLLFAPDVCQGPDGRYYLYYAFDFLGIMSVAVCDTPAGEYKFLGHIHYADGTLWGRRRGDQLPFDPGVLADDDGRVWLYSGFYNAVPAILTGGHKLRCDGGTVLELEKDMVTIKTEPRVIFPKKGPGAFQGHEFLKQARYARKEKPISSYTPLVITMSYATLPAKALTEISLTAALWLVRVISSWTATCPKSTQLTIWAIHMAGCSS